MSDFLGAPYPIQKHPRGYLFTQNRTGQIKSDLLVLLLTNPGERVMLPDYGTPLNRLIFEPKDETLADVARQMIIDSIEKWEPRIAVQQIDVSLNFDENELNPEDLKQDVEHILGIRILFLDPSNITEVDELRLQVPLAGV